MDSNSKSNYLIGLYDLWLTRDVFNLGVLILPPIQIMELSPMDCLILLIIHLNRSESFGGDCAMEKRS